jgi:hypothetical protein
VPEAFYRNLVEHVPDTVRGLWCYQELAAVMPERWMLDARARFEAALKAPELVKVG